LTNAPATTQSNLPAVPNPGLPEGLEDIESTDITMPIFRIDHENGVFVNGLTNETMESFDAVILGVIKQRILWPREVGGEGEAPMCRSYDFKIGIPRAETWVQVQPKQPAAVNTAVKASGFTWDQVETAAEGSGLSCGSCNLKEWGQDRTPPWCNEQWTMPFARLDEDGDPVLGVISFQRTGLKPCKSYVSGFVQAKSALYTVVTRIKAVVQNRGTVAWVTPSFTRLGDSDVTQWPLYSKSLAEVRDYLTTPRVFTEPTDDDEEDVAAATTQTATVSQPAPAAVQPVPSPEPEVEPEPPHAPQQATQEVTEQEAPPARRAQPTPAPAPAAPAPSGAAEIDDDEEPF
jgi:hypothetical protein